MNKKSVFSNKIFSLQFPDLVNYMTFPWWLSNFKTYTGFPVKQSCCIYMISSQMMQTAHHQPWYGCTLGCVVQCGPQCQTCRRTLALHRIPPILDISPTQCMHATPHTIFMHKLPDIQHNDVGNKSSNWSSVFRCWWMTYRAFPVTVTFHWKFAVTHWPSLSVFLPIFHASLNLNLSLHVFLPLHYWITNSIQALVAACHCWHSSFISLALISEGLTPGWPQSMRKNSSSFPAFLRAIHFHVQLVHSLSQQKVIVIREICKLLQRGYCKHILEHFYTPETTSDDPIVFWPTVLMFEPKWQDSVSLFCVTYVL